MGHDFNTEIVEVVAHRPWRMPDRPWVMTQTWHDLLFAHWAMDPREIRSKVPPEFDLDLFEGNAWIGIVPFYMTNVAPRGIPSLPWVSEFPELNVRTYVSMADRPGVYFFSLDAGSALAAHAARILLNLPYHSASMTVTRNGNIINYHSHRDDERNAEFSATYEPVGEPFEPSKGSLRYFLTSGIACITAIIRVPPTDWRFIIHRGRFSGRGPGLARTAWLTSTVSHCLQNRRCCTSPNGRTWSRGLRPP